MTIVRLTTGFSRIDPFNIRFYVKVRSVQYSLFIDCDNYVFNYDVQCKSLGVAVVLRNY